ncbi:hypothetical protein Tco_0724829 [Tanacetum coccineum]|uniref:Uncharacterized protein n=1 Tax=Tanacetum coccineum TaxID=301880 RepID=A0ABQ4YCN3_9ASTR
MLAPKGPTFNGRPTFANLRYLKTAQFEKPCLYEIPYDKSDPTNRLVPNREETLTLKKDSRSKLNKDLVQPNDYTKLNSLYEIFKPVSREYHEQLAHENEVKWNGSNLLTSKKLEKGTKLQKDKAVRSIQWLLNHLFKESTSNSSAVGTNDSVAASFQLIWIHYHMLMLKLQRHTILLASRFKNQESSSIKDKDFHKLCQTRKRFKDLGTKDKVKKIKDSRSKITQHEGTSLQQRQSPRTRLKNSMSKQSQEIQDHVMTMNMEARNLSETKPRGRLLALKYRVKQGSSFQGLRPRFKGDC